MRSLLASLALALALVPSARAADPTLARLTAAARACLDRYDGATTIHACRREYGALTAYVDARMGRGRGEAYLVRQVLDADNPRVQPRCRYKPLEAAAAQRQANREFAKLRLREDLIGRRFAVTDLDFEITVDDPNALDRSLRDTEEAKRCFPFYRERLEVLRAEFDRRSAVLDR